MNERIKELKETGLYNWNEICKKINVNSIKDITYFLLFIKNPPSIIVRAILEN